jgi:hypothetical protein
MLARSPGLGQMLEVSWYYSRYGNGFKKGERVSRSTLYL